MTRSRSTKCLVCQRQREWPATLHGVPVDPIRREEWCRILGIQSNVLNDYSVVCSKHFKRSQYANKNRTRLKSNAVPSPLIVKENNLVQLLGGHTSVTPNVQPAAQATVSSLIAPKGIIRSRRPAKLVPLAPAPIRLQLPITFLPFPPRPFPVAPPPCPSTVTKPATNSTKKFVDIRPRGPLPITIISSCNKVQQSHGNNLFMAQTISNILPEQIPISTFANEDEEKPALLPHEEQDPLAPDSPAEAITISRYPTRLVRMKQRISSGTTHEADPLEILSTLSPIANDNIPRTRARILSPNIITKPRFIRITGLKDFKDSTGPSSPVTLYDAPTSEPDIPISATRERFLRVNRITFHEREHAQKSNSVVRHKPPIITLPEETDRIKERRVPPPSQHSVDVAPLHPQQAVQMASLFPIQSIFPAPSNMVSGSADPSETQYKDLIIEIQRKALEALKTDLSTKTTQLEKLSQRFIEKKRNLRASRNLVASLRERADVGKILRETFKDSRTLRDLIVLQYLRYSEGKIGSLSPFTNIENELAIKLFDLLHPTGYEKLLDLGFRLPDFRLLKQLQNAQLGADNTADSDINPGPANTSDTSRIGNPGPLKRKRKLEQSGNSMKSAPYKVQRMSTSWNGGSNNKKAEEHVQKHQMPKRAYTCTHPGCGYVTNKKSLLMCHKLKHVATGEGLTCRDCQMSFKSSTSFTLHKRRCQKRIISVVHVCPGTSCHFTTFEESSFRGHLKSCSKSQKSLFLQTVSRHTS